MPTQELEQIEQALGESVASIERLLRLIGQLQRGLSDAITVNQLKELCEAISYEVELSGLLRGREGFE